MPSVRNTVNQRFRTDCHFDSLPLRALEAILRSHGNFRSREFSGSPSMVLIRRIVRKDKPKRRPLADGAIDTDSATMGFHYGLAY